MKLPVGRSFRARLTLWNVVVLSLCLFAFGLTLAGANQARMSADIDRDLTARARGPWPPGPEPPGTGPGGPGPGEPGRPGDPFGNPQVGPPSGPAGDPRERTPPGQPPQQFGGPGTEGRLGTLPPPPPGPPRDIYATAELAADVRRPKFFDATGRPVGRFHSAPFDEDALKRAIQGTRVTSTTEYEGQALRVLTVPKLNHGTVIGITQVAGELQPLEDIWKYQIETLLLFLPVVLVAAALGANLITNRALRPVGAMTRAAAQISETDLSRRLPVEGDDEMAHLAGTFNTMLARIESSFVSLRAAYSRLEQAFEVQRQFTADASHELRTPLARIRLAASAALSEGANQADQKDALEVANVAAEDMTELVQELLTLSKADAGQLGLIAEPKDLRVIAADALGRITVPLAINFHAQFEESEVRIVADEAHLSRVVLNLLENAFRHIEPGGSVILSVRKEGSKAVLAVSDSGEGIPEEHVGRVFERFYRVSSSRTRNDGGSGLGLAICKSIVDAHGGTIDLRSQVGAGTTVQVTLPLAC